MCLLRAARRVASCLAAVWIREANPAVRPAINVTIDHQITEIALGIRDRHQRLGRAY